MVRRRFLVPGEMETEKRKWRNPKRVEEKRRKREGTDGVQTVTDEELAEFVTILRRIQAANKYFKMRDAGGHKLAVKPWRPCFEAQDFDEHNDANDRDDNGRDRKNRKQEAEKKHAGLDLNTDP